MAECALGIWSWGALWRACWRSWIHCIRYKVRKEKGVDGMKWKLGVEVGSGGIFNALRVWPGLPLSTRVIRPFGCRRYKLTTYKLTHEFYRETPFHQVHSTTDIENARDAFFFPPYNIR